MFLSLTRNGHATTGVSIVKYAFGRPLRLSRGWDHCHAAIADATLGENTIGEVLHVSACPPESGHLHAAIVVEMDV